VTPAPSLTLLRFVVRDFKSLKHVELSGMGNLVVLMGRNNAGKSNFLDAFNFVADATRGLDHALAARGGSFAEVVFRKRPDATMELSFEFALAEELRARLIGQLFADNTAMSAADVCTGGLLRRLTLTVRLGADRLVEDLAASNLRPEAPPCLLMQHKVAGGNVEWITGQLEELCRTAGGDLPAQTMVLQAAPAGPDALRLCLGRLEGLAAGPVTSQLGELVWREFTGLEWMDPHRSMPAASPIQGDTVVAPNASNLPDVLHWIYNNKPSVFRRLEAEVHRLVPHLGKLYTPTSQNNVTLGAMDPEDEDLFYTMGQLSYGTKSAIAVVAKLALARPGAWFSIEEPETYLHPLAQIGLFEFLREEARTKRVFVATHSTAIAAAAPIDSLFIVQRDDELATVAEPVTEREAYRVIDQLGVQPTFNFESEAIVFVEGSGVSAALYEAWARKHPFQVTLQFLDAEEGATLRFFANARIALSQYVHTLVYAVFGSRAAETGRARVVQHLKLPAEQTATLDVAAVEHYLLDAALLRQVFPGMKASDADLEARLAACREEPDARKAMTDLLHHFKLGPYTPEVAARLAGALAEVPAPVKALFERIDLASKPFWKI
jgi:predicted ATPase